MTVYKWSQTAASNATADASINWAEGQAPSSVNDSARATMAAVAKYRDDQAGTLTTGGTSTAYTLTTNQVFASLSAMSGASLRVKFNATNGAAPTLNVDGLGAKAIVTVTGAAVPTASILANSVHDLVYSNSSSEWILIGARLGFLNAEAGTKMLFQQTAAPSGWTKDTTHNDKALRVVSGTASSGGSTEFSSVFASRTIAQANLPNVNFTVSGTISNGTNVMRLGGGSTNVDNGVNQAVYPIGSISSNTLTLTSATAASGGSGTGMDFAVAYVDCIICTKD